jgi:hypothetical protein
MAAFTKDSDFLTKLDYDEVQPLLFGLAARRRFLTDLGVLAGAERNHGY